MKLIYMIFIVALKHEGRTLSEHYTIVYQVNLEMSECKALDLDGFTFHNLETTRLNRGSRTILNKEDKSGPNSSCTYSKCAARNGVDFSYIIN